MRTLVLTENFLPSVGGSINWLVNTYSHYAPNEVVFVAPQEDRADQVDYTLPFRVERIAMGMPDWDPTRPLTLYRYLSVMRHVRKRCSTYHIQQIHCAKVLPEGLVAWCIALLDHVPYLLYAHGEELQFSMTSKKFRWLLPRIYRRARAVIANSQNTKSLLINLGVQPHKIHIIHPGVDVQRFRTTYSANVDIRRRFNITDAPLLLTVGRLQRRKGHDMVIKALPHIRKKFPKVTYLIVGDGEEFSQIQELSVSVGVAEQVIFARHVADEELPYYYAACDLFIMPNREIEGDIEGFGIVFLEAAAAGKPVVGGRSGGTDDAILEGITGLRVDGHSEREIAQAVIALLSDSEKMRSMGTAGCLWVEKEFTWDSVVLRTQRLSQAVCSEQ